jgi:hypothetical protein
MARLPEPEWWWRHQANESGTKKPTTENRSFAAEFFSRTAKQPSEWLCRMIILLFSPNSVKLRVKIDEKTACLRQAALLRFCDEQRIIIRP